MASDRRPQNYANHVELPTLSVIAFFLPIVALGFFLYEMMRFRGPLMYGVLCLWAAVMALALASRVYTVRLQDRIIRMEMKLRLERLGLGTAFDRLTTPQVVALRFAGDAELPALIEQALAGRLTNKQIKQAVRDWQADYHRT
jgi:hypothetical protein